MNKTKCSRCLVNYEKTKYKGNNFLCKECRDSNIKVCGKCCIPYKSFKFGDIYPKKCPLCWTSIIYNSLNYDNKTSKLVYQDNFVRCFGKIINNPNCTYCKLNPRFDFNCMNDFSLLKLFKKEDYSLKIRDLLIRSDKWKYYEVCFASINRPCLDCICEIKLENMQVLHRPPELD